MPLHPPDVRAFQASLAPIEQDWSERANKRAALEAETRNRDAMARANAAEAQQRERALADEDAMRRIATEAAGDWDVMIERATALNPELGAKLTEQRGKAQQATAKAFTEQLAAEQKRTERALSFLTVAQNDPELYDRIAPNIAALLPEELQAALPQQHDPAKIGFLLEATVDAKSRMERADKLNKEILSGDAFKGVLGQLAEQDTEEEWNGVINTYAAFLPKGTLALLPKWGADAQAKAAAMAMTPGEKADNARQDAAAVAAAAKGERDFAALERHRRATEGHAAATERRLSTQAASGGAAGADRGDLIEAVIANPGLYDQITATERGKIAGELQRRGFTGFGRPLSEGAAKQIAATDSAMQSLADLREILKKNEQYIGPIAGLSALNPYSDARKAQADIDLVRQRVGKALEGGVLRKEDENKYKAILATLRDTPETAIYKTDQLIKNLETDKAAFIHQQRLTGRRVPQAETPSAAAAEPADKTVVTLPDGRRKRFPSGAAADAFKRAAGIP